MHSGEIQVNSPNFYPKWSRKITLSTANDLGACVCKKEFKNRNPAPPKFPRKSQKSHHRASPYWHFCTWCIPPVTSDLLMYQSTPRKQSLLEGR
jgi:hypothetical protein